MDAIEEEYIRKINRASDTDEAYELSVGLKQYRELYQPTGLNLEAIFSRTNREAPTQG